MARDGQQQGNGCLAGTLHNHLLTSNCTHVAPISAARFSRAFFWKSMAQRLQSLVYLRTLYIYQQCPGRQDVRRIRATTRSEMVYSALKFVLGIVKLKKLME